jgi:hypothetical protein
MHSLIPLRQYASYDTDSDAAVTGILSRLGSLLSNVNSSDKNLPIIPLHTSFRDFLTNKDKSGGVRDGHHQLAHSCLNLLLDSLDGLKFNICKLETSYLANDDVADLSTRVDQHIPAALLLYRTLAYYTSPSIPRSDYADHRALIILHDFPRNEFGDGFPYYPDERHKRPPQTRETFPPFFYLSRRC